MPSLLPLGMIGQLKAIAVSVFNLMLAVLGNEKGLS